MAKRTAATDPIISAQTEHKIEAFAEDLGKLLGHAQNRAQDWLGQKKQIVAHLEGIRDTANGLLSQLGHQAQKAVTSGTRAYRSATKAAAPGVANVVEKKTRVLGLFSASHMGYESARASDVGGEPSLAEMTATAIRRLSRGSDGYVLLVEGGRIDHAHHEGRAGEALSETVAFDNAIRAALELTRREDTLIVATADHSHTLTMSGYARRGSPILGLSTHPDGAPVLGLDGRPYTTLGYANGPGSVFSTPPRNGELQAIPRPDLTGVDTQAPGFRQPSLTPLESETHGGEDVAIYAWGPGDEMAAGTLEENAVFHIMARALGFEWR